MKKKEWQKKMGLVFMVGLPGPDLDSSTLALIQEQGINNFILFKRNVVDPGQLTDLCHRLISACRQAGLNSPLISIDQEGGTVARLVEPFTQFPDARKLAQAPEAEVLLANYARTCVHELLRVGINMNLSPVLDVCPEGEKCFMERRVLGDNPREVARLGRLVIERMQEGGLAACAKHFPGLGAAKLDPHVVMPVVEKSFKSIVAEDLEPFREAATAGVAAIMTSHTIYPSIDKDQPATLSRKILSGILRDEIGYDGIIVTDDLEMGAIEDSHTVAAASVAAFRAGSDLLLICHEHHKVVAAYNALGKAIDSDRALEEQLLRAAQRVEIVQRRYAIPETAP